MSQGVTNGVDIPNGGGKGDGKDVAYGEEKASMIAAGECLQLPFNVSLSGSYYTGPYKEASKKSAVS